MKIKLYEIIDQVTPFSKDQVTPFKKMPLRHVLLASPFPFCRHSTEFLLARYVS